jgi:hypothetical protein
LRFQHQLIRGDHTIEFSTLAVRGDHLFSCQPQLFRGDFMRFRFQCQLIREDHAIQLSTLAVRGDCSAVNLSSTEETMLFSCQPQLFRGDSMLLRFQHQLIREDHAIEFSTLAVRGDHTVQLSTTAVQRRPCCSAVNLCYSKEIPCC